MKYKEEQKYKKKKKKLEEQKEKQKENTNDLKQYTKQSDIHGIGVQNSRGKNMTETEKKKSLEK